MPIYEVINLLLARKIHIISVYSQRDQDKVAAQPERKACFFF